MSMHTKNFRLREDGKKKGGSLSISFSSILLILLLLACASVGVAIAVLLKQPDLTAYPAWVQKFIADFRLNFISGDRYKLILNGLWNTLVITFLAVCIGIVIGVVIAAVLNCVVKR